ncbi:MAG: hypothetical protein R8K49_04505 [Mariprofundaceae bacterium]
MPNTNYPTTNHDMLRISKRITHHLHTTFTVSSLLLLLTISQQAYADVVAGDFIYSQQGKKNSVEYHVRSTHYQGIKAWKISWKCPQLSAEHFLRHDNGKPLYTKRINHTLQRQVEITYSQNPKQPSIYRKHSENKKVEYKIWGNQLQDLGTLPQFLLGFSNKENATNIHFSAINYDDGKVYPFIAKRSGFRKVKHQQASIRYAIYEINIDSWLSAFAPTTQLLIPATKRNNNFIAYNGPSLDGSSDTWSLQLNRQSRSVALIEK